MPGKAQPTYGVEALEKLHDRGGFTCGSEALDRYLHQQARQDADKRVAAPFVLVQPPSSRVLGYYTLNVLEGWTPMLLGIVAASMIYVAVADLIPGLHRRPELRATLSQSVLIALGIGSIALVRALLGGLA